MGQNEEPKAELIIVGDDWERFLSSLEKFMSLQQKTLQKLKELGHRNEALRQELRDAINLSRAEQEPARPVAVQQLVETSANRPIERLKFALQPVKNRLKVLGRLSRIVRSESFRASQSGNLTNSFASCEKCGHQIKRASRFCEGCGGDFGAMMCSCGRELNPGDKFCDHCGRTV
ncbi:MAG: zinc ribbon domain-containing protein [Candidatus Bathyarchaeia archaeon]|jgi:hypothetical protein